MDWLFSFGSLVSEMGEGKVFWIVENGAYVKYIRHGSCNKCGLCCCSNEIGIKMEACMSGDSGPSRPDINRGGNFDEWEGYSHHSDQRVDWWWKLDVKDKITGSVCESFDPLTNLCDVWDEDDFPAVCRYFPFHPRDIEKFPDCGFSFERVDSDKPVVVKRMVGIESMLNDFSKEIAEEEIKKRERNEDENCWKVESEMERNKTQADLYS
jgi:hypothetical protein